VHKPIADFVDEGWYGAIVLASTVTFCINDGVSRWDNNNGEDYAIKSTG
jgi:hypothetical protein